MALVITGTEEAMVRVSTWLSAPYWLAAPMVIGKVPLTIGGPAMTPVAGSRFNPAGRPLALNEAGLLLAIMV